jgi:hypothetical protein
MVISWEEDLWERQKHSPIEQGERKYVFIMLPKIQAW